MRMRLLLKNFLLFKRFTYKNENVKIKSNFQISEEQLEEIYNTINIINRTSYYAQSYYICRNVVYYFAPSPCKVKCRRKRRTVCITIKKI